jgi:hypothetical protein
MADITVQVSSAGLTAYGADAYGYGSFGGNATPIVQVQTAQAYNLTGWGGQTWSFANWGDLANANSSITGIQLQSTASNVIAFPQQGWGGKQWGVNLWGDLINNAATPAGIELTATLGTEEVDAEINQGWGRNTWGSNIWNGYGTVIPTSIQLNTPEVGSVTVTGEINEGWGRLTWGENAWGAAGDVVASGNQLSISLESNQDAWGDLTWSDYNTRWGGVGSVDVGIFNDAPITQNQELNSTTNSVSITIATEIFLSENPLNALSIQQGQVGDRTDVFPTGQELSASLGTAIGQNEQGWGRDDWGVEVWGAEGIWQFVDVTGLDALSIDSGIRETWGQDEWGASTTEWGGISITEVDLSVNVPVTSTYAPGWGADIAWGAQAWGDATVDMSMSMSEGTVDPAPDTDITGEQLNTTVNAISISADANLTLTGEELSITLGDEEATPNTQVDITGIQIGPFVIGDYQPGINGEAYPTGVTATTSTGIIGLNAWAVVDPGNAPTWTVVDIAA